MIQPRTPSSPPLFPTKTRPCTISGAMVIVWPSLMSPSLVCQTTFPVAASRATVKIVESVEHDLAVTVRGATVDHVAAGLAPGRGVGGRVVRPLERAIGVRQVDRVHVVRVRCHDVHGAAHHQRRALVAAVDARREGPGHPELPRVLRGDLVERAVARVGVVAAGKGPFAGTGSARLAERIRGGSRGLAATGCCNSLAHRRRRAGAATAGDDEPDGTDQQRGPSRVLHDVRRVDCPSFRQHFRHYRQPGAVRWVTVWDGLASARAPRDLLARGARAS